MKRLIDVCDVITERFKVRDNNTMTLGRLQARAYMSGIDISIGNKTAYSHYLLGRQRLIMHHPIDVEKAYKLVKLLLKEQGNEENT